MAETQRFEGGCHCGGVRFVYRTALPTERWPVRRCTCSFCVRLGARYTSAADATLQVAVQDPSVAADYEFGTKTAKFFRCNRCGVMLFARSRIDGSDYAVLNVNTLDDSESLPLAVQDMDFDGEEPGDRLRRRRRNWIADVTISFGNA